jgi:DNA-binding beta-propeller fold protein YncE
VPRFSGATGVTSDRADTLYVVDNQGNTVRKIAVGASTVTTLLGMRSRAGVRVGPLPGGLNFPIGVAVQPDGILFVTSEAAVLAAR